MAKRKYQTYTEEFRREAVKRAGQPGNTAASVAKELSRRKNLVKKPRAVSESERVHQLRKKVQQLKTENDMLRSKFSIAVQ